jgi:Ca2+-binding EF-hand superfamily protein
MYRPMLLFFALVSSPVIAAAQQPCTSDARPVVDELYRHMLERPADARSNYWVQQLQSGRTVRDLVREFAKSDEHAERFWRQESGEATPYLRAVGTLYRHILAVQPNAATARTFANQATRRGMDPVIDQIVDSADYSQRFGDWGVPGSGGLQYCGSNNQAVSRNQGANVAGQARFRGMDANNDGVISRTEWRGNRVAFDNQDWNRDGVLSEDELEPAAARGRGRGRGRQGNQANQQNQTARRAERFDTLDINNNGRLEPREWNGTVAAFNRLDGDNDNVITRAEMVGPDADEQPAVATSGQSARTIRVEGRDRWTDTGITVRAGQILAMDSRGTVRLGPNESDVAGVDGTLSGRRDNNAPIGNQPAGGLIARIGNSPIFYVGDRNSFRAPAAGRLYLGVNDNSLADNAGDFQVVVDVQP